MTVEEKEKYVREHLQRQAEARALQFSELELSVYGYCKARWDMLDADGGYNSDIHDEPVLQEAAAKYGLTKSEVLVIWDKTSSAGQGPIEL